MTGDRGSAIGISPERIVEYYPRLFHMAEAGTWQSIQRHGLLSTSALLDLFEKEGVDRRRIESTHRPDSIRIEHQNHGVAVVRDQKPMRESALLACLKSMSPQQWYEILNQRVFFWPTRERLLGLLSARAYRGRQHCVITVDTARLLERHIDRVTLSPINSGSTIYRPQPRGRDTFLPPHKYPFEARRRKRGIKNAVAELAVDYAVPDIADLAVRVDEMVGPEIIRTLYRT